MVSNGPGGWNIYFGGWDGVSSCHDSVSVSVTENNFATLNPHFPMIATGAAIHVNNPSAIKVRNRASKKSEKEESKKRRKRERERVIVSITRSLVRYRQTSG